MKIRRYIISALPPALLAGISAAAAMQSHGVEQTSPGPRPAAVLVESFDGLGAFRMSGCGG